MKVDMTRFYREEDLFPRLFAAAEERPFGILFHNAANPDSFDSNHALIFRDRVDNLPATLDEIAVFYCSRGLQPCIYQSILDEGWFGEIAKALDAAGWDSWLEEQTYMALTQPGVIEPDPAISVRREDRWQEAFADCIFLAAGEPWEIAVARQMFTAAGSIVFVARAAQTGAPIGMIYGHRNDEGVCRVDYLLVAPAHRGKGAGRALTHAFAAHCREQGLFCALWPDGDSPRRIYEDAGFRTVETRQAGRASLRRK